MCFVSISLKKNLNALRVSEHPKRSGARNVKTRLVRGRIIECQNKTSSWHSDGFFPDGSNIGLSQQYDIGEKPAVILYTYMLIAMQGHQTEQKQRHHTMSLDYRSVCYIGSRVVRCL